jgi:hypothetical protein
VHSQLLGRSPAVVFVPFERLQYQPRFGRVNRRIEGRLRTVRQARCSSLLLGQRDDVGRKMTDADRALSIEDKGDCRYSAR